MKKLLIVFGIFLANLSYGQIANIDLNGVPLRVTAYSGIDGSPYLYDEWSNADLTMKGGSMKEKISARLNIHDNELEVINEAGNKILLDKSYLTSFVLERPAIVLAREEGLLSRLTFKNGFENIKGLTTKDFVNVLAEGQKYTLVRKFYSDLVTPPKNSYTPTPGRMFVFEQSFYIIDDSGDVNSVRAKSSSITKGLSPQDKALAKQIIKENKYDLSREDHLVSFFMKLNSSK
ncbi:hypothetical protein SAMN06295967_10812 [Belliella buryatensis]|uniref:Uncharacterized protein n=1 Tax=Belliella buryatensis TaxID=1500549 RepID=A0A239DSD6_9BACT|nr:hypothetical protein [Belliella buryatensis]SNS35436.1 hypothetical protein SAMN06295967_10812 [Belliella buryatensis]